VMRRASAQTLMLPIARSELFFGSTTIVLLRDTGQPSDVWQE